MGEGTQAAATIFWIVVVAMFAVISCQDQKIHEMKTRERQAFEKKYYDPCEYTVDARPRHCR